MERVADDGSPLGVRSACAFTGAAPNHTVLMGKAYTDMLLAAMFTHFNQRGTRVMFEVGPVW
jgi:hypothetical protein